MIEQEKQKLWQEETSWAAWLLRPQRSGGPDDIRTYGKYAQAPQTWDQVLPASARSPLIFEGVDFAALDLTQKEQETIERLRQNFLDKMNGEQPSGQEPRRPWENSQRSADELLRASVGWQRFNQIQLAVSRQKIAQSSQ
jgi:hypothetical protein